MHILLFIQTQLILFKHQLIPCLHHEASEIHLLAFCLNIFLSNVFQSCFSNYLYVVAEEN